MVGLVPIEKDVIPMVLLVNMHLIKGTLIIFPCDLAGYRAIPMVHWYQLGKWDNLGGGGGTPLFGPNGYVLLWSVRSLRFLFLNGVYNFTI